MSTRGTFLAASGALVAAVTTSGGVRAFAATEAAAGMNSAGALATWLTITPDGLVNVFTGKAEIGMGVITGLMQIVADELDVPMSRIRMTTADTALTQDQGGVGASVSIENGGKPLRNAAAEARRVLVDAAATRLGVAADQLSVADGIVTVTTDASRRVPYGELVGALAADARLAVNGEASSLDVRGAGTPKAPSAYRVVGKPVPRVDIGPKAYARFTYVVDVKVPGMVHARIVRPPAAGARPIGYDVASLAGRGDAGVVRIGDLLAVVASKEWDAVAGARSLAIRWSAPTASFPAEASLEETMWATPPSSTDKPVVTGDVDAAFAGADVVEARYFFPFQSHATMGPGCAVVDVRPDGATTAWSGGQKPHSLQIGLADLLGVKPDKVRVIFVEDAGSYGRAGFDDAAAEAALISQKIGRPVRVQWMRHDMTQWGPKGPAIVSHLRGALRDGGIAGLDVNVRSYNGGEIFSRPDTAGNFLAGQLTGRPNTVHLEYAKYGANSAAYAVPNVRASAELLAPLAATASPMRTTHLRDPEGPGTTFAVESFIDEMAARAGADPVEFRIKHLTDKRQIEAITTAAKRSGWETRPSPKRDARAGGKRHGRGIAFAKRGKTLVATVAEVTVDPATGAVHVDRFVCAHDCGLVINPRSLQGTIEANLMQSLSRSMYEEVHFSRTNVTSRDWMTYPVARAHDVPERVDVVMIDRPEIAPTGAGEPSSRPTAAAIANAIFDATGARVRAVPFTPKRVKAAIAAADARKTS